MFRTTQIEVFDPLDLQIFPETGITFLKGQGMYARAERYRGSLCNYSEPRKIISRRKIIVSKNLKNFLIAFLDYIPKIAQICRLERTILYYLRN